MNVYRYEMYVLWKDGGEARQEITVPTRDGMYAADKAASRLAEQWMNQVGAIEWSIMALPEGDR